MCPVSTLLAGFLSNHIKVSTQLELLIVVDTNSLELSTILAGTYL